MALLGTDQSLLWPGDMNPGGGGLAIASVQRSVAIEYAMGTGAFSATSTISCVASKSYALPAFNRNATDGSTYFISELSGYIENDTTFRKVGYATPPPATFNAYFDIYELASTPKSIQYILNSAATVAIPIAVSANVQIFSQIICSNYAASLQRWTLNSPTEIGWVDSAYHGHVICLIDP